MATARLHGTPVVDLPIASAGPFVLLLLAMAFMPLVAPHWWERNSSKALASALLALPFAAWFLLSQGHEGARELSHALIDFLSFIALLGALFAISGNLHFEGSFSGRPLGNAMFLALGAVLANLIGTTCASMVLIRPLIEANRRRVRTVHVYVFFILVVSNCGGLLTPLGDPPLFLGFLKGVPFTWTLRLLPVWALVVGLLLLLFLVVDTVVLRMEDVARPEDVATEARIHRPLRIHGAHNLLFLAGVVVSTLARGRGWGTGGQTWPFGLQEGLLVALATASYFTTGAEVRLSNRFSFTPIIEVAVVFAGIFTTMVAPLRILNAHGAELGLSQPWHYFWATGLLSSFLDNAPTYLTFAASAAGASGVSLESPLFLRELLASGPEATRLLAAISCGAVLMGAITYIGNGPNLMVKSIVEASGIRMPSFLVYMLAALITLGPILAIVTFVFLV